MKNDEPCTIIFLSIFVFDSVKKTCLHTMASRIRICIRIVSEEEEKNRAFKHNNVQHKYINWIYN